ncbi:hypothetical protein T11_2656 [Trichinella zimbabwensis]|uniref:MULE transposase domain-containing protein n=1 Tax=Trichinella zimbabwensis TaxID=268475 RepID=A0A0V1GVT0_9BILA|nr:hypothetical protein T11_2656 [Trichinella zimbabwensis]
MDGNDKSQFVPTIRNQQKLAYRGRIVITFYKHYHCDELKRLASGNVRPVTLIYIYIELASNACTGLDTVGYVPSWGQDRSTPHAETCTADESVLHKIEKRNTLKRRTGEETKPVPQIYGEECNSASTNLETDGQFQTYKMVKAAMYRSQAKRFPLPPAAGNSSTLTRKFTRVGCDHSVWCMDGTFKIVPEWYQQMFTIHHTYCEIFDNLISKATALGVVLQPQTVICDFETALIHAVQGLFPGVNIQGCYFHFCQAVLRNVAEPGLQTRYLDEAETKKKFKILMAAAFLPLSEVPAAVDLLGRNVTGSVAALFVNG